MTDRFTHDAAPYVLGALAPDERRAFEDHLDGCPPCTAEVREFAGLPGLLSRLPTADVPAVLHGEQEPPVPDTVLPPLLLRVRREQRTRRRRAVLVGVAAAVLAAVGSAAVVGVAVDRPAATSPTPGLAFARSAADVPASAEATVTDVSEGTRIDMTCRYEGQLDGRDREYVLRVVPKSGAPTRLDSWPVLSTADYRVDVVAPLPRDRIDYFEVVNATGKSLLTLRP